ncbi:hypothetical protein EYZ11_000739 [Aspergillus tanneri]|uniref:Uncharacterized protein n=1 Tax=Aspergillus tanneri TaxID=1220188 RepID=A0A4S3JWF6_9EURO|nr:uncharacterized protein ATNIH1004_003043 [Aspergillus tanneri]KAA8650359.1 hypothetical protein ATNIH1004_003043 [Aspergillus tanneri]THC99809.1 hypothetical protein EYZ11_000739 [Aspergillus tanneri]
MEQIVSKIKDLPPVRTILSIIWNDPIGRVATVVTTYLVVVATLRFQRLRSVQRQYRQYATRDGMATMTVHDAWEIQKRMQQLEYPTLAVKALQFALFRTYGIPSISSLLLKTSQFSNLSTSFKRYADTSILIAQFILFEPSSDRAVTALARTKYLHVGYRASGAILDDDLLYTLSLFVLQPIRFIAQFEWRAMSDLERCAIATYWKYLGDALDISYDALPSGKTGFRDGLHFLEELEEWSVRYEKRNMVPNAANKALADRTMDVMLYTLPRGMKHIGLRYDRPSRIYCWIFNSIMGIRRLLLRYCMLPRPYFLRTVITTDHRNDQGRYHVRVWSGAPYYVQPTFRNRWGPSAWFSRLLGLPVPGDEGEKYSPHGYEPADLGPKAFEGKGHKTVQDIKGELACLSKLPFA